MGSNGGNGGDGGDACQGAGVYCKTSTNISLTDNIINTIKGGAGGTGGKKGPFASNGANGNDGVKEKIDLKTLTQTAL